MRVLGCFLNLNLHCRTSHAKSLFHLFFFVVFFRETGNQMRLWTLNFMLAIIKNSQLYIEWHQFELVRSIGTMHRNYLFAICSNFEIVISFHVFICFHSYSWYFSLSSSLTLYAWPFESKCSIYIKVDFRSQFFSCFRVHYSYFHLKKNSSAYRCNEMFLRSDSLSCSLLYAFSFCE